MSALQPIPENILQARTPGIRPQFFENTDHVRNNESLLLRSRAIEQVECERTGGVFWIEINDIVRPVSGDVVFKEIIDELGMRIDYGNAVPCGKVGRALIPHDGRLSGT